MAEATVAAKERRPVSLHFTRQQWQEVKLYALVESLTLQEFITVAIAEKIERSKSNAQ